MRSLSGSGPVDQPKKKTRRLGRIVKMEAVTKRAPRRRVATKKPVAKKKRKSSRR